MHPESYRLAEVLAVADIHPFYNPRFQYPPEPNAIQHAQQSATKTATEVDLRVRPMVTKKDLYVYHVSSPSSTDMLSLVTKLLSV